MIIMSLNNETSSIFLKLLMNMKNQIMSETYVVFRSIDARLFLRLL